jgi:hypothetical protein
MADDGGRAIREDFEEVVRAYLSRPLPLFGPWLPPLTKRQRLSLRIRDLRWRMGHWIAGYDCDDDG